MPLIMSDHQDSSDGNHQASQDTAPSSRRQQGEDSQSIIGYEDRNYTFGRVVNEASDKPLDLVGQHEVCSASDHARLPGGWIATSSRGENRGCPGADSGAINSLEVNLSTGQSEEGDPGLEYAPYASSGPGNGFQHCLESRESHAEVDSEVATTKPRSCSPHRATNRPALPLKKTRRRRWLEDDSDPYPYPLPASRHSSSA
ncbi:hypothetical protein QBC46DRAFT_122882 [Diplogelasinospora grovesii]|uniref:Uncharacterized protein n=1 Tax=Diplogelasinospora grovesii TaxID=303347 RepID=A0AAN6N7G9_9PEZI|nr:hypothetical protein QBC46DRAFT_122882 [Diplogelasinospora grovesii]